VRAEAATGPDTRKRDGDEAVLVARLAAGDRDSALAALYDAYGSRIYRLGLLVLGDSGLAEDLVQETFVRLWRSAGRYDAARASVRTFVFTLARRAAVDLWRRRGGPLPAALDEPEQADVAGGEAFEHLLLRLDVREALERRDERLSPLLCVSGLGSGFRGTLLAEAWDQLSPRTQNHVHAFLSQCRRVRIVRVFIA
jgi:RNA polymerase sigma-70 factor (ECF subfamily)